MTTAHTRHQPWLPWIVAGVLAVGVLALRWPTFGFNVWNVDEAIHAAAARTILDGGVLYRDAIDQRTPLSYYAVAAVFAVSGANNLWAVRCAVAGLIAATAFLLFLAGRRLAGGGAGAAAAALYALLSSSVLFPGDAYAANTEWFVTFFTAAAAVVFLGGTTPTTARSLGVCGALLGCSFLSKQPALLDLAAPVATLAYVGWRQPQSRRGLIAQLLALGAGWLAPVLLALGYFGVHGALHDGLFYTWTYNLSHYGPEVTGAGRLGSLIVPFQLVGSAQPWLLALWVAGALLAVHRLLQRQPAPQEDAGNPGLFFLAVWSLAGLGAAVAGGRGFDHYSIPFLAPLCLGAGWVLAGLAARLAAPHTRRISRLAAGALLAVVIYDLGSAAVAARQRRLPVDPSVRVSAYIREHSAPTERIFVWGYHPDIYLFADRRPASRYLYASFVTGLIPWTNTAPDRDTAYAIVPGAMDTLLHDLAEQNPAFIVDCSAGPNRHWQKYPLEKFPPLNAYIRQHYEVVEGGQFVPQGFRLFQRRANGTMTAGPAAMVALPADLTATLKLNRLADGLVPIRATAPNGANVTEVEGRLEYFAHAPSSLVYRVPAGGGVLRGAFGIRPGAYATENPAPTDGAEFIIRWRPEGGVTTVLLQRLLRPREVPADRALQPFRLSLSPGTGGELELAITPGPTGSPASDWTFWSDLILDSAR